MPAAPKKKSTAAASTPAKAPAKKAPAKKAATATAKPKAAPASKAAKGSDKVPARRKHPVTAEQRRYYVEVAAYYIAERHGFSAGRELADWTAAEAEIDRLLAAGALNP